MFLSCICLTTPDELVQSFFQQYHSFLRPSSVKTREGDSYCHIMSLFLVFITIITYHLEARFAFVLRTYSFTRLSCLLYWKRCFRKETQSIRPVHSITESSSQPPTLRRCVSSWLANHTAAAGARHPEHRAHCKLLGNNIDVIDTYKLMNSLPKGRIVSSSQLQDPGQYVHLAVNKCVNVYTCKTLWWAGISLWVSTWLH